MFSLGFHVIFVACFQGHLQEVFRMRKLETPTLLGIISSFCQHPDVCLHLHIKPACYTGTAAHQESNEAFTTRAIIGCYYGVFLVSFWGRQYISCIFLEFDVLLCRTRTGTSIPPVFPQRFLQLTKVDGSTMSAVRSATLLKVRSSVDVHIPTFYFSASLHALFRSSTL